MLRVARSLLSLALVGAAAGSCRGPAEPGWTLVADDPTDLPVRSLTPSQRDEFDRGDALFSRAFRASQGLGPVYIRASCAACHEDDGRGPGVVERHVSVEDDGFTPRADQALMPWGPVARPLFVEPATRGIDPPPPSKGYAIHRRIGPAVFGRGWFEAVDPAALRELELSEGRRGRVRGRLARLEGGAIGLFGLKARVATLREFAADALRGDMGLTSSLRPDELPNPDALSDDQRPGPDVSDADLSALGAYVAALEIPRRDGANALGRSVFERAGCGWCHVPSLPTVADAPLAAMRSTRAQLYSDLLLHDMGVGLADGVAEGAAGPRDWRTAPLMGLRFARSFLHDGRALTLDAAVRAHASDGSEAGESAALYLGLSATDRAALQAFLETL